MNTTPQINPVTGMIIQLVDKRELDKLKADNAELLERLADARESHLAASSRDVQTIQQQSVMLERLASALKEIAWIKETGQRDFSWKGYTAFAALSAYESANLEPVNPIDEVVKRMEAVPVLELNQLHFDAMDYGNFNDIEAVRARLIQAAKGEQL